MDYDNDVMDVYYSSGEVRGQMHVSTKNLLHEAPLPNIRKFIKVAVHNERDEDVLRHMEGYIADWEQRYPQEQQMLAEHYAQAEEHAELYKGQITELREKRKRFRKGSDSRKEMMEMIENRQSCLSAARMEMADAKRRYAGNRKLKDKFGKVMAAIAPYLEGSVK